ncbi:hypothetical protein PsAD37_00820 [Pseudovibrio sp. Ad37]|nr:hypothetical protein PsAD37_00820 [Pseudovibrio sp. Ad37]
MIAQALKPPHGIPCSVEPEFPEVGMSKAAGNACAIC